MPRVTKNNLGKFARSNRRKRTSVATRAKYQKPTARNQKSQILGNALAIRTMKKLMPQPIYTDWQYSDVLRSAVPDTSFSETTRFVQLMSPYDPDDLAELWQPVLRQDENVIESSATKVLRMQLNLRYRLGQSNWAQFTTFVVSLRRDATDTNPANLVKGEDYIVNAGDDFNVRLNPAVFKVHYARNVSLMYNAWVQPAATVGQTVFAGNPNTTFAKGQVNMKLNFNIRQPTRGESWTKMFQSQMPPSQRMFLITFIVQQGAAPIQPPGVPDSARLNFDALYTCYNAS